VPFAVKLALQKGDRYFGAGIPETS